jgi:hypothetical protein
MPALRRHGAAAADDVSTTSRSGSPPRSLQPAGRGSEAPPAWPPYLGLREPPPSPVWRARAAAPGGRLEFCCDCGQSQHPEYSRRRADFDGSGEEGGAATSACRVSSTVIGALRSATASSPPRRPLPVRSFFRPRREGNGFEIHRQPLARWKSEAGEGRLRPWLNWGTKSDLSTRLYSGTIFGQVEWLDGQIRFCMSFGLRMESLRARADRLGVRSERGRRVGLAVHVGRRRLMASARSCDAPLQAAASALDKESGRA